MLIRKDREFAHDASIIQTLVSRGYITGELKKGFPATNIVDPDNFVSLLYYFGMLTVSGMHEGKNKLTISNQVVQEQLYIYLLNTYNEADLSFSNHEKSELCPISEADTQEGYADIFLCPLLDIYPDMQHSYIIELKYAKYKDPESRVEELRREAVVQANRYADTDMVKNAIGNTQLHKIVVVYKGMEMRVCEEV